MTVDIRLLKAKLKYHDKTYYEVAQAIGMNRDTFTRRLEDGGSFRVREVQVMMEYIPLTRDETWEIFFGGVNDGFERAASCVCSCS